MVGQEPPSLPISHRVTSNSCGSGIIDPGRSVANGSAAGVTAGKWPEG